MLDSLGILAKMTILEHPYNLTEIKERLDNGTSIIVGDMIDSTTPALKYMITQIDGLLYAFKLVDSTNDTIVLTPEQVALYTDEYASILLEYLKQKDFIIADDDAMLDNVESFFGDLSHDKLKKYLSNPKHAKDIVYINDARTMSQFKK